MLVIYALFTIINRKKHYSGEVIIVHLTWIFGPFWDDSPDVNRDSSESQREVTITDPEYSLGHILSINHYPLYIYYKYSLGHILSINHYPPIPTIY